MLSMHYVAHADMAFLSVELIMRDVNHGWLIRYMHANGASFFLCACICICCVVCTIIPILALERIHELWVWLFLCC